MKYNFRVELAWFLYRVFGKKRKWNCGRGWSNRYTGCLQPWDMNRYYIKNGHIHCKVCDAIIQ